MSATSAHQEPAFARRTALAWSFAALTASALGLACGRSSGAVPRTPLERAMRRARACGRPVLVVVVPEDADRALALARSIGEAIDVDFAQGNDQLLADLALCEVACATRAQLVHALAPIEDDAEVILIEPPAERGSPWTRIELEPRGDETLASDQEDQRRRARANQAAICAALAGSEALLARRERDARAALPPEQVARFVARLDEDRAIAPLEIDEAAVLVRTHPSRPRRRTEVVGVAYARLVERAPDGARWGSDESCIQRSVRYLDGDDEAKRDELWRRAYAQTGFEPMVTRLEDERVSISCGIGYVQRGSARFLVFYTDEA